MKLNNKLLNHQQKAVDKLIGLKVGALFMDQGTGKTITTLELARIRIEKKKINMVIWLCPCSAKGNIKREIIKQCPTVMYQYFVICGIETLSTSIRANSYLRNLTKEYECYIVVDESLLIKNPKAYRTENILRIAERCKYRIILNGTPISRNAGDLFAQFYLLDWRILGYKSYWSFSANHIVEDKYGNVINSLNMDVLAKKIEPYTFQVLKSECLDLPNKYYNVKYFELTSEQDDIYDYVADRLIAEVDEWKPETIYRLFSGLQAVISGKRPVFNKKGTHFETEEIFENPLDNPRIKRLLDVISEEKTIVFCRYQSEIEQLCSLLAGSVRFDGMVTMRKRERALLDFSEDKKYLVSNRGCAGYSLNLQFCHRIIYLSNDWDLGTRLQSEDRIHRLGQEDEVSILDLCAENTIDEKILSCLKNKEYLLSTMQREIDEAKSKKQVLKSIIRCRKKEDHIVELEDKYA